MNPDEELQIIPSGWLRAYSAECLLGGNVYKTVAPQKLAEMLLEYRTASAEWAYRDLFCAIGRRLVTRFNLHHVGEGPGDDKFDALDDSRLVELAVLHGIGFALGAAWYSKEADLLWAAAAALTKFHGCKHPNEIERSTGGD